MRGQKRAVGCRFRVRFRTSARMSSLAFSSGAAEELGERVIDIGCGPGFWCESMADADHAVKCCEGLNPPAIWTATLPRGMDWALRTTSMLTGLYEIQR